LTLYNASDFLSDGVLIPTSEKRAQQPSSAKPAQLTLTRPSVFDKSKTVVYSIVDDVSMLKSEADWNRVVAVFVHGPSWQFTGWPSRWASPAAIFESVCAFHLYYDDEPLNKNIVQWKVHRLCASRTKRYADRSLAMEFWNILTEQMQSRNNKKKLNI